MKTLAILLIAVGTLLSGCIAYDPPNRNTGVYRGDRDGVSNRADRDGDGVPNRQDRRPNDPTRY